MRRGAWIGLTAVAGVLAVCASAGAQDITTVGPGTETIVVINGEEVGCRDQGVATYLSGTTCNYDWWYGCSPTSAGMLMGYYDRKFLVGGGTYYNLVPGGYAETNSYGGGGGLDFNGDTSPDLNCNQAIASAGHIADYYIAGTGASNDDQAPFHANDCLADFMGTSQDAGSNSNGSTSFWYRTDGQKTYPSNIVGWGVAGDDGMYGLADYVDYRGYGTATPGTTDKFFTQLTDNESAAGFTFAEYMAEIDAGRPVMVHISGHTMCGYGYDAALNRVYVYDTWNPNGQNPGYMAWGGTYAGEPMWGVTCATMTGGKPLLALWNPPDWWKVSRPTTFSLRWDLRTPQWEPIPFDQVVPPDQPMDDGEVGQADQAATAGERFSADMNGLTYNTAKEAWGLDGENATSGDITLGVDNCADEELIKNIFVQFRMQTEGDPDLDIQIVASGLITGGNLQYLGDDGAWGVYEVEWTIDPQPGYEQIIFDMLADSGESIWIQNIDVGTDCVPEPATLALLALGGLAALARRRRAA